MPSTSIFLRWNRRFGNKHSDNDVECEPLISSEGDRESETIGEDTITHHDVSIFPNIGDTLQTPDTQSASKFERFRFGFVHFSSLFVSSVISLFHACACHYKAPREPETGITCTDDDIYGEQCAHLPVLFNITTEWETPDDRQESPPNELFYPCFDIVIIYHKSDFVLAKAYKHDLEAQNIFAYGRPLQVIMCDHMNIPNITENIHSLLEHCSAIFLFITVNFDQSAIHKNMVDNTLAWELHTRGDSARIIPIYTYREMRRLKAFSAIRILSYYPMNHDMSGVDTDDRIRHFNSVRNIFDRNHKDMIEIRQSNEDELVFRRKKWLSDNPPMQKRRRGNFHRSKSSPAGACTSSSVNEVNLNNEEADCIAGARSQHLRQRAVSYNGEPIPKIPGPPKFVPRHGNR